MPNIAERVSGWLNPLRSKETLTLVAAHSLYLFRHYNRFGEFRVDVSTLPMRKKIAPGEGIALAIIVFISIYAAANLYNFSVHRGLPYYGVRFFYGVSLAQIFYWLTFPAAFAIGYIINFLIRYRAVTFERLDLAVTEPDGTTWRSGYRQFLGIRERVATFSVRPGWIWHDAPFKIVELVHPDTERSILLFACVLATSDEAPTKKYAEAFRLPVLNEPEATY